MNGRPLALLALFCMACRSEVQLGDPRTVVVASPTSAPVPPALPPPRCVGPARVVVALADDALGDLVGITAGNGWLYALLARGVEREGVVARVRTSGGELEEVAHVGNDPAALTLAANGTAAFVRFVRGTQIARIDVAGTAVLVDALGTPAAIFDDGANGAYWTNPEGLVTWDFVNEAPRMVATLSGAGPLLRVGTALYVVADGALHAFEPTHAAVPRRYPFACDATPALAGRLLYCAHDGRIVRLDLDSAETATVTPAQSGAGDVVITAGRLFWRTTPTNSRPLVMSTPLGGTGSPDVFEFAEAGPALLTTDGCDLYFNSGRSLIRRRF